MELQNCRLPAQFKWSQGWYGDEGSPPSGNAAAYAAAGRAIRRARVEKRIIDHWQGLERDGISVILPPFATLFF